MSRTGPCVVRSCEELGVCLDDRNYTKWNADLFKEPTAGEREIWYCQEHARQYLFPLIDRLAGNSLEPILKEFKKDGML